MDKHTGSSYDGKAQRYIDSQDVKPWTRYFDRPSTLAFLPETAGLDVLDAGCGPGFYAKYLLDGGARVTAFDRDPVFVDATRVRTDSRAQVYQADLAEPLEFCTDSSFDLVVAILVLHYVKDWRLTLEEFYRVLRPGGQLVISTHHPFTDLELALSGDYFALEMIEDEWDIGTVRYYRRPLSQVTRALVDAGFALEELGEPQPVKPPDGVEFSSYEKAMKMPRRLLIRARKPSFDTLVG